MTGFHRRTNFSAPTALVNAGLIPIPLFSFAPGQKAFTAALPLIISFGIIISALQGKCKPPAQLISQNVPPRRHLLHCIFLPLAKFA